jgi:hypothetical protein
VFFTQRLEVDMKSILDPSFRYTTSAETDLRKTFARVRRELRKQRLEQSTQSFDETGNVLPFPPGDARRTVFACEAADVPPVRVDQSPSRDIHGASGTRRH